MSKRGNICYFIQKGYEFLSLVWMLWSIELSKTFSSFFAPQNKTSFQSILETFMHLRHRGNYNTFYIDPERGVYGFTLLGDMMSGDVDLPSIRCIETLPSRQKGLSDTYECIGWPRHKSNTFHHSCNF